MGRARLLVLAGVLVGFVMAPTVGDIGSCGQPADDLDAPKFFQIKKVLDCQQCQGCGLMTQACTTACDTKAAAASTLPDGCHPYVHDGEVCLRALIAASCDDYASYESDSAPTAPSECQFCPVR